MYSKTVSIKEMTYALYGGALARFWCPGELYYEWTGRVFEQCAQLFGALFKLFCVSLDITH